jgi:hypothetical protein
MGRQGKPRFQLEGSLSGFRYKKTDSDVHPEQSAMGRPPTAGWTGTPSHPGTGGRQPVDPRPLRTLPRPPRLRPATVADSAGGLVPGRGGEPTARTMARPIMPDIAAHSAPCGAETDLGRPGWTQSLAGHHWPQSARHIGPTCHSTRRTRRLLRATDSSTDSDGTCRPPASTHRGSARQDKAVRNLHRLHRYGYVIYLVYQV